MLAPWKKSYHQSRQHIKKQKHYFADKVHIVKAMVFPVVMLWMWELDHKDSWVTKNWSFEMWCWRRLESPLDCKEIKPVHSKGNQSWIFIGRTDVEAKAPILWPPNGKNWLIGKDLDVGKDWKQEETETEEKMLDVITDWIDMSLSKLQDMVVDRESWRTTVHTVPRSQKWTEVTAQTYNILIPCSSILGNDHHNKSG